MPAAMFLLNREIPVKIAKQTTFSSADLSDSDLSAQIAEMERRHIFFWHDHDRSHISQTRRLELLFLDAESQASLAYKSCKAGI